ncbi:MAG: SDR family oxidoreductase, partial [Bacteroidales bacterium]|nr:SDR family oxidoreductase [Bacteroidales bacterium]
MSGFSLSTSLRLSQQQKLSPQMLQSINILALPVEELRERIFEEVEKKFGKIDFLLHAVAFSNKAELSGLYVENTTRENFKNTMDISVYSFTDLCRRASKIMNEGGSCVTLTYLGGETYIPNYNVMGVAKSALDASVRYLASDLGHKGIRVNAISAGP